MKTYEANDKKNGGSYPNIKDIETFKNLVADDVTSPGTINIPVCTENRAAVSYDSAINNEAIFDDPIYPCVENNGRDWCRSSTFEKDDADKRPAVGDCLQIVKNIDNSKGDHTVGIGSEKNIQDFGECAFYTKGYAEGNVVYRIGNQDIIDIIRDCVKQFEEDGRVACKGHTTCNGANTPGYKNVYWRIGWNSNMD